MAVMIYEEGEHPGGFIGARVSANFDAKNHEMYFSFLDKGQIISDEKKDAILQLAHKQDIYWKEESKKIRRERMLNRDDPKTALPKRLGMSGFYADIVTVNSKHGGVYFYPCFKVQRDMRAGCKSFRIDILGFDDAWDDAVNFYADRHKLSVSEKLCVNSKKPQLSIFKAISDFYTEKGIFIPVDMLSHLKVVHQQ